MKKEAVEQFKILRVEKKSWWQMWGAGIEYWWVWVSYKEEVIKFSAWAGINDPDENRLVHDIRGKICAIEDAKSRNEFNVYQAVGKSFNV